MTGRPRILFVVAAAMTAEAFLLNPMRALAGRFDIALVLNGAPPDFLRSRGIEGVTFPIAVERAIRPWRDLVALWRLFRLMRRERFDAVHSVSPKAGLLAMAAGAMARVPLRTHTFTGQVWATRSGFARRSLKAIDALVHRLSSFSLVDSASQRDFLLEEGVVRPESSGVLGDGSICGVDLDRFRPDPEARRAVRRELALDESDLLFLYVGRITTEKGVVDLARAFRAVHGDHPRARLVLVGPEEGAAGAEVRAVLEPLGAAVRLVGHSAAPERYMAASDVFCLPSYREGFGSVLIEAAAAGLPAMASRIYGVTDAVEEGRTGLLHRPADAEDIARTMTSLAEDEILRRRLGEAASARARALFSAERLNGEWAAYYDRMIGRTGARNVPDSA